MTGAGEVVRGIESREVRLLRRSADGTERVILDGLTAVFPAGSLSLISGPIGSGKTTFLHVLSTILRPSSGEVLADGEVVSRFAPAHRERWRRSAGLAFQAAYFLDNLTVLENTMVPLVPGVRSLEEARERAQSELTRCGMGHLAGRAVAGLSGGERQRVTLARALVGEPRFLFVDEPTAHQDPAGSDLIVERLAEVRATGATIVVVSHDPRLRAEKIADTIWEMSGGRLVRSLPGPQGAHGLPATG